MEKINTDYKQRTWKLRPNFSRCANPDLALTPLQLTVFQCLDNLGKWFWPWNTIRRRRHLYLVISVWSEFSYLLTECLIVDRNRGIRSSRRFVVVNLVTDHAVPRVLWGLPRDLNWPRWKYCHFDLFWLPGCWKAKTIVNILLSF